LSPLLQSFKSMTIILIQMWASKRDICDWNLMLVPVGQDNNVRHPSQGVSLHLHHGGEDLPYYIWS